MATNAAIATALLPSTVTTVDLTVTGFGTVDAAIIIVSNANSANNPQEHFSYSIGFWDGVNSTQGSIGWSAYNNQATTDNSRDHSTTRITSIYDPPSLQVTIDATCSAIPNGVRLTVVTDNTGVQRYISAILINGLSNVYLGSQDLGTGTSAVDITAPGFKPDMVFLLCAGLGAATVGQVHSIHSFGVAHNSASDVVTQGAVYGFSEDALATVSKTGSYVTNTYCVGQYFNDAISWQASASAFDASGFSLTPTASASNDDVIYLALEFASPSDGWVGIIDSATSMGNSAKTGVGFQPDIIGLVSAAVSALDTVTADNTFTFGVADSSTQRALFGSDDDALATSDASSEADLSNVLHGIFGDGTDDYIASLSSMDSDGFTLNYSDASVTPKKILAFAIGDSTAGAGFSPYWAAGSNVLMNNGSP